MKTTTNRYTKIALLCSGAVFGSILGFSSGAFANQNRNKPVAAEVPLQDSKELQDFAIVYDIIKQDYVEPVSDKVLMENAIRGMVTGLDPHSDYMNEEEFKALNEVTHGEFGGLGIEIAPEDGFIRIVAPIEDSPAFVAGVKSGDLIVKIGDISVKGLSLNDAVKKMRGKPGTKVQLTILRKTSAQPLKFNLTRAIIKAKSVKSRLLEADYGYIRVAQFQARTTEELATAVKKLYEENKTPLKGLVLDLRDDPGGLLNGAVGVSAAFLPKDSLVVYTEGRTQGSQMRLQAKPANYMMSDDEDYFATLPAAAKNVPLIVLVNGGSASASEIVAGALQDHNRALIVGTQTFGKGSVQSVVPLPNSGGVKITTARYFTPNGRSIQAKGILPDKIIEETESGASDRFVMTERDYQNALSNPTDPSATEHTDKPVDTKKSETKSKAAKDAVALPQIMPVDASGVTTKDAVNPESKKDYQLDEALKLLKNPEAMKIKKLPAKG
jgi:carboxyl-terminal processing protease